MRTFLGVLGVIIALFSAFFVVAFIGDLATGGGKTEPGVLWGLLVFFLGTGTAGIMMARTNMRRQPATPPVSEPDQEQQVLQFAESQGGRVTLAEVAAHCRLGIDESKAALERLVTQGVAELHVTDEGVLVYAFPGFLTQEEKQTASDPLEPESER